MTTPWMLLHGTPLTPRVWDAVGRRLGDEHEMITPDVSLGQPGDSIESIAGDLVARLPSTGRVHLAGHSLGGEVALALALRAPARIASLTVLCARDTPFPAFRDAAARLRADGTGDPAATLARWFRPDELVQPDDPAIAYARSCVAAADPIRWARALDAIATFDRSADTPRLDVPTHLVAAELDTVSTVAAMTDLHHRIRGSRLSVVADAAHLSLFRDPDRLVRLLRQGDASPPGP